MSTKFSSREIDLIKQSMYQNLSASDIQKVLEDNDYKRSITSIKKKITQYEPAIKQLKRNAEKATSDIKAYRIQLLYSNAKSRAKDKNIEFNLTREWITEQMKDDKCAVSGESFIYTPYKSAAYNPYAPSLDRIDSSKGYTTDNVQVVLVSINTFKMQGSDENVIELANKISENNKSKIEK